MVRRETASDAVGRRFAENGLVDCQRMPIGNGFHGGQTAAVIPTAGVRESPDHSKNQACQSQEPGNEWMIGSHHHVGFCLRGKSRAPSSAASRLIAETGL